MTPDHRMIIVSRMSAGFDLLGQTLRAQQKEEPGSEAHTTLENQVFEILYYIACEGARVGMGVAEIRDMGMARGRLQ
ncbi:hypothetical protein CEW88_11625 [Alloyangia pacifica]|uniref:Uncharacterized protein n=1 Tax=Alloyangia pacifica TaxID=311180 RepID=A0A2U8HEH9_9RHOB|nr:hypothetical protein [Alloyangia pacifica]AWI84277.1 hypothetical protein CEW88_11625 [Alloyangia pacifica]